MKKQALTTYPNDTLLRNFHNESIDTFDYKPIIDYYTEASNEYEGWSDNFNMHFGYLEKISDAFDLEGMLNAMNHKVLQSLKLIGTQNHVLDMGCGYGATLREMISSVQVKKGTGITIVPTQVLRAQQLALEQELDEQLEFRFDNFHHTEFEDQQFDGIFALEAACHSPEYSKHSLLSEAYRLLKPGKRFTMADGFVTGDKPLNRFQTYCYNKVCQHWALGNFANLEAMINAMKAIGFEDIKIENASRRVAPSVCYIPFVAAKYFWQSIKNKKVSQQKWGHLLAPLFLLPLSLNLHRFGYYIVSAKRPEI